MIRDYKKALTSNNLNNLDGLFELDEIKKADVTENKEILNNDLKDRKKQKQFGVTSKNKVAQKTNFIIDETDNTESGFISDYYICHKELVNSSSYPLDKLTRIEKSKIDAGAQSDQKIDQDTHPSNPNNNPDMTSNCNSISANSKRIKCSVIGTKYKMHFIIEQLPYFLKVSKFSQQKNVTILCIKENLDKFIFVFDYGVSICWGLTIEEEDIFNHILFNHCDIKLTPTPTEAISLLRYYTKSENFCIISATKINVESMNEANELLAISYALAQSTILLYYEHGVDKTIDSTRKIPIEMRDKGVNSMSVEENKKSIGEIFVMRSAINLYSEILDNLDIFWENDELENFYQRTRLWSNIDRRNVLLKKRMLIMKELYDILINQIEFKTKLTTEWIIVYFVIFDIFISIVYKIIMKDYLKII